ncbi:MAG: hypothetical protein ACYDHW_02720 [Syntrophorhabdaceae bacterium]
MKKTVLVVLIFAVLFIMIMPALGDARGGYHYRPYYGHHRYHGSGWGYGGAAAGGFVLGAIVGSSMYRPAPVYAAPPPPPPPPPRAYYYYPPPAGVYVYPY